MKILKKNNNQFTTKHKYYERIVQEHSNSSSYFVNIPTNLAKELGLEKGSIIKFSSSRKGSRIIMGKAITESWES